MVTFLIPDIANLEGLQFTVEQIEVFQSFSVMWMKCGHTCSTFDLKVQENKLTEFSHETKAEEPKTLPEDRAAMEIREELRRIGCMRRVSYIIMTTMHSL